MNFPKVEARRTEDIVVAYAAITRPSVYVEIGISEGDTFNAMVPLVEYASGCDVRDVRRNANGGNFRLVPSSEFIAELTQANIQVDLAFIDGDHTESAVKADFLGILPLVRENGLILLHDTWPLEERYTGPRPADEGSVWWGDAYKVAEWIKTEERSLGVEAVTVTDLCMTLVRKGRKAAPWL